MDTRVAVAYIVQVLVWGTTWAAIAIGVRDVPPWTFALSRSILVAGALAGIALALRMPFPRDRRTLAVAAIAGGINSGISWAVIFWAEQFVPSGLVAVFGATAPIWTAFLAHFTVRGDRLSFMKVVALALGFGGVLVLVGASGEIEPGRGLIAAVLLAIMPMSWAVSGILMARYLRTVSPMPTVAIGAAAGGLFLVPLALLEANTPARWTSEAILALLYLSFIGSGVGLVINLWLFRKLRPTTVMLSQLLITTEAVLIGALVLGEEVTTGMLVGAVLVLAAIALNARAGGPRRVAPPAALPEEAVVTPAD